MKHLPGKAAISPANPLYYPLVSQSEWENLASLLSLAVGCVAAIVLASRFVPAAWIDELQTRFKRCSQRPLVCGVALAAVSITINTLIAVHNGIPQPMVHDESSYLLAGDTFAHARLTNPTPPFPEHFETPQQLMTPTYMSKYFPGQGIALALGQVLTGRPIVGVWLSTAAAVVGIYWMLLGFFSRPWALLGAMVATLHPQLLDWSQTYWGGSVATLGSAVFIGAWGRLMLRISPGASMLLALSMLILGNSRPFEGSLVVLPLLIALALKHKGDLKKMAVPAGIVLLMGVVAMGYYNDRITGNAFELPYLKYADEYEIYPKFWFLPPRSVRSYSNPAMAYVHRDFERLAYLCFSTVARAIDNSRYRFNLLFSSLLNQSILLLPLAMALLSKKTTRLRWITLTAAVFVVAMWTEIFLYSHYLSPLLPAIIVLVLFGWQRLQFSSRQPVGRALALACVVGFLAGSVMSAAQPSSRDPDMLDQHSVVKQLPPLQSGRHLVFVSYAPMHSYHAELVHNLSDLDQSRIIWARSLGPDADRPVAEHFKDRQVWTLHVGGKLDLKRF